MTAMRIVQFRRDDRLRVAIAKDPENLQILAFEGGSYGLALRAVEEGKPLRELNDSIGRGKEICYQQIVDKNCLLPPVTHPDPAHCLVTGTGLTHLGSADTRNAMHTGSHEQPLTDSMRMFNLGLEGGKPLSGSVGVQPEWFYKGDGRSVAAPYSPIRVPAFALDAGEEPELVGIYLIRSDRTPCRLGFATGNEFSDHITERQNYLWLAHSKLRDSSFGPELFIGELPSALQGVSRILRTGQIIRAGDLHIHFFGTSTLSFADGLSVQHGDEFEIDLPLFGRPLRNQVDFLAPEPLAIVEAC